MFGWFRGSCIISDCDCKFYQPEDEQGGACQSCSHWPAQHANLGNDEPFEPPAVEKITSKNLNKSSLSVSEMMTKFSIHSKCPNSWEINPYDLDFAKKLNEGPFSTVYCGAYRGQEVAIKVFNEKINPKALEEYYKQFNVVR